MTASAQHQARAVLLDAASLAWPADLLPDAAAPAPALELWGSPTGGLAVRNGEVTGGALLSTLTLDAAAPSAEQLRVRRHLASHALAHLDDLSAEDLAEALAGQLAVAQRGEDGRVLELTGVQIAAALDDLYAAAVDAPLGVTRTENGAPQISVWAPTARSVRLLLGARTGEGGGTETELAMERGADGVWTALGDAHWWDRTYRFDVEVYVPATDRIEHNLVTDPSSVGLTLGSARSVIVDFEDPRWRPETWEAAPAPRLERQAAQMISELHVRDFSAADDALPPEVRGTYAAFGHPDSRGRAHLAQLAQAGLTTLHLLPTFDIGTIPDDRAEQLVPQIPADAGPASPTQQAAVMAVADRDAFNWGYDPVHWMTPEGSYARPGHQEGGARTREFREMVGALHELGLQVVLDQVFNHTHAAGQDPQSVLDRVVPGYYHRLDADGAIEQSTCCNNVATEHAMAQRLMTDALVVWARCYRVDGFRFDLMGHATRENMLAARAPLDALTLEADGVDGRGIYLYGEGWDFGEVAGGARFTQASQGNLQGTSIGCFNDRLRDGMHGGGPTDEDRRAGQGLGTGELTEPNGTPDPQIGATPEAVRADLLRRTDLVRLGLAGSLADFSFLTADGAVRRGDEIDYSGQLAGFTSRPEEAVNYVDAHDNEALWDLGIWKLPADTPPDARVRMHLLMLAMAALGQSPGFWSGGTELLRSKSMDRDSYDSGDHFNAIDWTGTRHGFGRGLPPDNRNLEAWPLLVPMLEDPAKRATPAMINQARAMALDLLHLRASTPLFTLGDAGLIREKVSFPGAGPEATPGLLVMRIDDTAGPMDADPQLDGLLLVLNARPDPVTERIEVMAGIDLDLSPIQADGADPVVRETAWDAASGTVTVPARTVAVLVQRQGARASAI